MGFLSKIKSGLAVALLAAGTFAAAPASAADLPSKVIEPPPPPIIQGFTFFTRVGASGAFFNSHLNASTTLPFGLGTLSSNEVGKVGNVPALYLEAGVYLTPNVAVSISGGYPPTLTTTGQNSLAGAGTILKNVVGLPIAQVTYHLTNFGPFRPYAGVGVAEAVVFHDSGAYLQYPDLKSQAGFVIVGGADYDITSHWSVFVDVKKIFLTQQLTGQAPSGAPFNVLLPTTVSVRTDPVLATLGVGYRF